MTSSLPTRRFHVGEVLSVTTGTPIGREAEPGLYDLVAFMVLGESNRRLMDRELLSVISACRASLYQQVPGTERIKAPGFRTVDEVESWLLEQIKILGVEEVDLEPLPLDHPARDLSPEAVERRVQARVDAYMAEQLFGLHRG